MKDEALDEFYYVTHREEVMALFEDIKPMTTEPGTRISVLCSAPEHYYRARSQGFYSPKSELAPFIEAELAKQGIVFEK
ncbi:hypothetical protein F0U59_21790 [Archangium gephyra]|nr:hypothetical protein F0U59_21790 [Archangium gephyra]